MLDDWLTRTTYSLDGSMWGCARGRSARLHCSVSAIDKEGYGYLAAGGGGEVSPPVRAFQVLRS